MKASFNVHRVKSGVRNSDGDLKQPLLKKVNFKTQPAPAANNYIIFRLLVASPPSGNSPPIKYLGTVLFARGIEIPSAGCCSLISRFHHLVVLKAVNAGNVICVTGVQLKASMYCVTGKCILCMIVKL